MVLFYVKIGIISLFGNSCLGGGAFWLGIGGLDFGCGLELCERFLIFFKLGEFGV